MDRPGLKEKQPPECEDGRVRGKPLSRCPNIKEGYQGWDLERYECSVCGMRYTLYDEDMA